MNKTSDLSEISSSQPYLSLRSPISFVSKETKKQQDDDQEITASIHINIYSFSYKNFDSFAMLQKNNDRVVNILQKVISYFKKNLDYTGYYIAYLLGQLTDNEFNEIAKKFVIKHKNTFSDEELEEIRLLLKQTKETFSASELSNIFGIKKNLIENKL